MQCSLELMKIITTPHLIFAGTCAVRYIRYGLKPIYISNCEFFLPSEKLIFPFVLGQVLKYCVNFSLFWVGFPNQHLQGLLLLIFFLKTRVIKLLISNIFNIKKINILIYRKCAVRSVRFSYYKTVNYTTPCSVLLPAMRCDYVILWTILMQFLWFGEHP